MPLPNQTLTRIFIILSIILFSFKSYTQCSPETGPPPSNVQFNTGTNGTGSVLPGSSEDLNWQVSTDSMSGTYQPAIVMSVLPPDYYKSPWADCTWISVNSTGSQSGDKHLFYKMNFALPCNTICGKSYNADNSFCLSLDLFADNSIYEIYVNGFPQSRNLGNIFPVSDPLHAVGATAGGLIPVSLCHNWKAGINTIVIEVASSAPETGLLVQASTVYPQSMSGFLTETVCRGDVVHFGDRNITQTGNYFETFKTATGCDSTVALNLKVKPATYTRIDTSICEGESYLGLTIAGTYSDTFVGENGCDSIRTINLLVVQKPSPQIAPQQSICSGDTLILSPGIYLSYVWQDGTTSNNYVVRNAGDYSVVVDNGCDTAQASTHIEEKVCHIYFPTAFTPNHDGRNDQFKILTEYQFQEYHLSIYNRWGQMIFDTYNPSTGWDGSFKGTIQQNAEAFVWFCRFKRNNITSEMKGTVMLIR